MKQTMKTNTKPVEVCRFTILTPTPFHDGGKWCGEDYPCKTHGEWKKDISNKPVKKEIIEQQSETVDMGHVWINAFRLINPSEQTRLEIGDMVIKALKQNEFRVIKFTFNQS